MNPDPWDKIYAFLDFGVELSRLMWIALKFLVKQFLIIFTAALAVLLAFLILWTHPFLLVVVGMFVLVSVGLGNSK